MTLESKHWLLELHNEWTQLFDKYNWYTWTLFHCHLEKESMAHGYEFELTLLGLGFRIRYNTDKSLKQFDEWDNEVDETLMQIWDSKDLAGYSKNDHTHCPSQNSPCGIEGAHRCCLCKKPFKDK